MSLKSSAHPTSSSGPTTAAVLEYRCLYTHDLRQKHKRWQDGRLKFHTFNSRIMVSDERGNHVGDVHWPGGADLEEGEEIRLERGGAIAQVGDLLGTVEQDLSELLDKRAKEKESRHVAASSTNRQPIVPRVPHRPVLPVVRPTHRGAETLHRPLLRVTRTPTSLEKGSDEPKIPQDRQRQSQGPSGVDESGHPAKRRRYDEAPAKSGYAQALFGSQSLQLSAVPTSSYVARLPASSRRQADTFDVTEGTATIDADILKASRATFDAPLPELLPDREAVHTKSISGHDGAVSKVPQLRQANTRQVSATGPMSPLAELSPNVLHAAPKHKQMTKRKAARVDQVSAEEPSSEYADEGLTSVAKRAATATNKSRETTRYRKDDDRASRSLNQSPLDQEVALPVGALHRRKQSDTPINVQDDKGDSSVVQSHMENARAVLCIKSGKKRGLVMVADRHRVSVDRKAILASAQPEHSRDSSGADATSKRSSKKTRTSDINKRRSNDPYRLPSSSDNDESLLLAIGDEKHVAEPSSQAALSEPEQEKTDSNKARRQVERNAHISSERPGGLAQQPPVLVQDSSDEEDLPVKRTRLTRGRKKATIVTEDRLEDEDVSDKPRTERRRSTRKTRRDACSPSDHSAEEEFNVTSRKSTEPASKPKPNPRLTKIKASVKSRELIGFDFGLPIPAVQTDEIGVPFAVLPAPTRNVPRQPIPCSSGVIQSSDPFEYMATPASRALIRPVESLASKAILWPSRAVLTQQELSSSIPDAVPGPTVPHVLFVDCPNETTTVEGVQPSTPPVSSPARPTPGELLTKRRMIQRGVAQEAPLCIAIPDDAAMEAPPVQKKNDSLAMSVPKAVELKIPGSESRRDTSDAAPDQMPIVSVEELAPSIPPPAVEMSAQELSLEAGAALAIDSAQGTKTIAPAGSMTAAQPDSIVSPQLSNLVPEPMVPFVQRLQIAPDTAGMLIKAAANPTDCDTTIPAAISLPAPVTVSIIRTLPALVSTTTTTTTTTNTAAKAATAPGPVARIANPATRGRKAALKSHAAGQAPQPVLPPPTPPQHGPQIVYVPVVVAAAAAAAAGASGTTAAQAPVSTALRNAEMDLAAMQTQPDGQAEGMVTKAEGDGGEQKRFKLKYPGFGSARSCGPWSAEAHDLLGVGRPRG